MEASTDVLDNEVSKVMPTPEQVKTSSQNDNDDFEMLSPQSMDIDTSDCPETENQNEHEPGSPASEAAQKERQLTFHSASQSHSQSLSPSVTISQKTDSALSSIHTSPLNQITEHINAATTAAAAAVGVAVTSSIIHVQHEKGQSSDVEIDSPKISKGDGTDNNTNSNDEPVIVSCIDNESEAPRAFETPSKRDKKKAKFRSPPHPKTSQQPSPDHHSAPPSASPPMPFCIAQSSTISTPEPKNRYIFGDTPGKDHSTGEADSGVPQDTGNDDDDDNDSSASNDAPVNQPPVHTPQSPPPNANNNNNEIPAQPQMQPRNGGGWIVWLLGLVIAAAAIGFALWTQTNNEPPTPPTPPPPEQVWTCPDGRQHSYEYIPITAQTFELEGRQSDHPQNTEYKWRLSGVHSQIEKYCRILKDDSRLSVECRDDFPISDLTATLFLGFAVDSSTTDVNSPETKRQVDFKQRCDVTVRLHQTTVFGIDLGTSYSCIGFQPPKTDEFSSDKRETVIVEIDQHRSEYCIPTAVYFPADASEKLLFGEDALKKKASDPFNVIYDVKRIIGRRMGDKEVSEFQRNHLFQIVGTEFPRINIRNRGIAITPEQALAPLVAHLVRQASSHFKVPYIREVVISIPAYFHYGQRKAVRSIARIAGLSLLQLVVEPTSAALAHSHYSLNPSDNFKRFLTFDFGGGTLDCSVLQCHGSDCRVKSVEGNSTLGGIDFDHVIKGIIADKFRHMHGWDDISPEMEAKMLHVAERTKRALSAGNAYHDIKLNDDNGIAYTVIVTRDEFENDPQTQALLQSAVDTARRAMTQHDMLEDTIKTILMVGGTSKLPIVLDKVEMEFGRSDLKVVYPDFDPQLMVVRGVAVIGGSFRFECARRFGDKYCDESDGTGPDTINIEEITPLALGFNICKYVDGDTEVRCGLMDRIVPKNTIYPNPKPFLADKYCPKNAQSTSVQLELYEGDDEYVENNYHLSSLTISGIPKRKRNECNNFRVELSIDLDGIAHITATIKDEFETQFTTQVAVNSYDGSYSLDEEKRYRSDVASWFAPTNPIIEKSLLKTIH